MHLRYMYMVYMCVQVLNCIRTCARTCNAGKKLLFHNYCVYMHRVECVRVRNNNSANYLSRNLSFYRVKERCNNKRKKEREGGRRRRERSVLGTFFLEERRQTRKRWRETFLNVC